MLSFIKELIIEPGDDFDELERTHNDSGDPDERKDGARWRVYYQDNKILEQIDKDVRRTLPDFAFFQLPIPYSRLCPLSVDPALRRKKTSTASNSSVSTDKRQYQQQQQQQQQQYLEPPLPPPPSQQCNSSVESNEPHSRNATPRDLGRERRTMPLPHRASTPNMLGSRRMTVTLMSPRAVRRVAKKPSLSDLDLSFWQPSVLPETHDTDNGHTHTTTPPPPTWTPQPLQAENLPFQPTTPADSAITPNGTDIESTAVMANTELMTPLNKHRTPSTDLPKYLFSPIPTRRSLFKRVAHLNQNFGSREHQPQTIQASIAQESRWKGQQQTLQEGDTRGGGENGEVGEDEDEPQDLHWEAIERILFVYAKLNPGVGYVQGMNEILGPLYYLMANDPNEESRAHAEAESFWLFHNMMAHFRDHFVRSLDRDRLSGIGSTIARMNQRLRQHDEELWQNLEDKGIAPEYYSFRWLTVLCTQEFDVPDVWRIWDSVLADTGGPGRDYDFLLDFCCAMVCHLKTELLNGDFADNVKLLQNYPSVDIQPILMTASDIRDYRRLDLWSRKEKGTYTDGRHDFRQVSSSGASSHSTHSSSNNHGGAMGSMRRLFSVRSNLTDQTDGSSIHSSPTANRLATIDGVRASDRLDQGLEGAMDDSLLFHTTKRSSPASSINVIQPQSLHPVSEALPELDDPFQLELLEKMQAANDALPRWPTMTEKPSQEQSNGRRWSSGVWGETLSSWKAKWSGSQSADLLPVESARE
ncbi:hypothetical protein BGZ73_000302 [Actinomortierella ambigua]|nr:hypothetical protein BGZ73_000302 [Actinomortierella ambigua]